jgi:hypothetical protein
MDKGNKISIILLLMKNSIFIDTTEAVFNNFF